MSELVVSATVYVPSERCRHSVDSVLKVPACESYHPVGRLDGAELVNTQSFLSRDVR